MATIARSPHETPVNDALAEMMRRDLDAQPLGGWAGERAVQPPPTVQSTYGPAFQFPEWDGSSFVEPDVVEVEPAEPERPAIPPPDWQRAWTAEQMKGAA